MKKVISVFVITVLLCSLGMRPKAVENDSCSLLDMTPDECIVFLKENGVAIPTEYASEDDWGGFAKSIIEQVVNNPNLNFGINHGVTLKFAEDIRTTVIEHYNISVSSEYNSRSTYYLQDSTVVGSWIDEYSDYNCYGYAIGYKRIIDPGYFSNNVCLSGDLVSEVADYVIEDLEALGYSVVDHRKIKPSWSVSDHRHVICIRKDTDGVSYTGYLFYDYHFMKLEADGKWYHKPATTHLLKFKYDPAYKDWTNERYLNGISYEPTTTYESNIHYITYTTPHEYVYKSCGSNQHISTCTICDGTTGSATACVYVNNICKFCGHDKSYEQIVRVPADVEVLCE